MLTLSVDPKVLAALKAAFPKPANSAVKALSKYINTLHALITEAQSLGKDPFNSRFGLQSISLHDLANRGGQIGSARIRVHAWLEQQGYALVEAVETGSNLTGRKSRVKLTRWVTVTDHHSPSAVKHKITQGAAYLDQPEPDEAAWIRSLYPGLEDMEEHEAQATYHITEVDRLSLARFILWLADRADGFSKAQRDRMMHQAMLIYRVAQFSRGLFLQRPKPSHFGRTYYAGVSVQNIHRTLRQAMLGDCWEYDITSAVIAWKLGQARRIQGSIAAYPITHLYLQDKDDVIRTIRADTIDRDDTDEETVVRTRIKTALTALSFGARLTEHGWSDDSGDWQVPALATIFRNQLDRARFFASPTTKAFVDEQRRLDKHLFAHQLAYDPALKLDRHLQTASGRPSRAKVLAFAYQHAETEVMDVVRAEIKRLGKTVLANIHDAIIVRERLLTDDRMAIEDAMRTQTGNPYWRLTARQIRRFKPAAD